MDEFVLQAARVTSGLLAGLYFAFAVSVMPALKRLPDTTFIEVMRTINLVIVNPVFLVVFLGAPASAAAVLLYDRSGWAIAGAALGVLTLLVTAIFNIPLNNELEGGRKPGPFEVPWVRWNIVRTLTGIASLVCLVLV
ncbi:MAG TPA: anthrone oxygenase family protein [Nocardioidaceae bacterium]|nr:anthrone oxygenase family protein [Nocardioidaceae bacterium]